MEPAYASQNLERLTGGRGGYKVHNVACWWMAWQAAVASHCKVETPLRKCAERFFDQFNRMAECGLPINHIGPHVGESSQGEQKWLSSKGKG